MNDLCPFEAAGTDSNGDGCDDVNADGDGDGLTEFEKDIDRDGDGLIEIGAGGGVYLGHIHHNLAGTSHKTSATVTGNSTGCPSTGCNGYELRKDITLTNNWTPVGDETTAFTGNFDGNGHTISDLTINSSAKNVGFFGVVGGDSTIRNLIISGGSVTSATTGSDTYNIGVLAGNPKSGSIVDNVSVLGIKITVDGDTTGYVHVGGLAGYNGGDIANSYATGDVDGGDRDDDRLRIGGLVGDDDGTITNSYATGDLDGGDGEEDRVGGLVGTSTGTITNSYATGNADGGDGDRDYVGGLVGDDDGTITNSYATGDASGGAGGGYNFVGGLVGLHYGTITNSYATGNADGGGGDKDYAGGLVGYNGYRAVITNSYATGSASGGVGAGDYVGGLVGYNGYGEITNSYATGSASGGAGDGDYVGGLVGGLYSGGLFSYGTITNSYATGNASGGAGTGDYAGRLVGYDEGGPITNSYANSEAEADAENTVASGAPEVSDGTSKTLTELRELDFITLGWSSDDWENMDAASNVLWPAVKDSVSSELLCNQPTSRYYHRPQCLDGEGNPTDPDDDADGIFDVADACPYASGWVYDGTNDDDQDGCQNSEDLDDNDNGLIEVNTVNQYLWHIRDNLAGTSYKTSTTDSGNRTGCPITGCNGYELAADIDLTGLNWEPVGDASTPFTGIFDGNGHTISNLEIDISDNYNTGFFGYISGDSTIRNLIINGGSVTATHPGWYASAGVLAGYIDNMSTVDNVSIIGVSGVIGKTVGGGYRIGGLVGYSSGTITNSYATGSVDGGTGNFNEIGGLVGWSSGTITNSYATGSVDDGDGDSDRVGGLAGHNEGGMITNSYATGSVSGPAGGVDYVGGLVGFNEGGMITNSYATGNADGGAGVSDRVGGLVGWNKGGTITNAYATGNADGGDGDSDRVGGLVGNGYDGAIITNSYATGSASGGAGTGDYAGRLVGLNTSGTTITDSYANSEAEADAENTVASGAAGVSDGDPKTEAELRSLTPGTLDTGTNPNGAGVGWTSDNWAGMDDDNFFPTLRSFTDSDDDDHQMMGKELSYAGKTIYMLIVQKGWGMNLRMTALKWL